MGTLIIRYFGGLKIEDAHKPIQLPSYFPRTLFAFLSQNPGNMYCRTFLSETLWPDLPLARGRRALSTALWRLRKCHVLADAIQQPSRDAVGFAPTQRIWVDTRVFRHLVQRAAKDATQAPRLLEHALDLYRGAAFSDLADDWAMSERVRIESTYCDALAWAAELALAARDFRRAEALATRLIAFEPYREDVREIQIRAALMAGNIAQAKCHYNRFAALLSEDLVEQPRFTLEDLMPAAQRVRMAITAPDANGFGLGLSQSIQLMRQSLRKMDHDLGAIAADPLHEHSTH